MSNTSRGEASKGSKFWMQQYVNDNNLTKILNDALGLGNIKWLSPRKEEQYKEYSAINDIKELSLENFNSKDVWPTSRLPQWDAIGINDKQEIILVEAKAHVSEIKNKFRSSSSINTKKVQKIIEEYFGNNSDKVCNKYYQIANRIIVSKNIAKITGRKVYLVFLYFVNDYKYISTSQEEFNDVLNKIDSEIDYKSKYDNQKNVFIEVK